MEFAILFIVILLLIFYNNYLRRENDDVSESKPIPVVQPKPKKVEKVVEKKEEKKEKKEMKNDFVFEEVKEIKIKRKLTKEEILISKNPKEAIFNSFREGKDLKNVHIHNDGKLILASDVNNLSNLKEKRIIVHILSNLLEKKPKCFTKNIENDVITDVYFCESKKYYLILKNRIIAVGLKNTKNIIFYEFFKNEEDNKIKLQKIEDKIIKSDHKFEINHLVYSKDGNYIATTGTNQDTSIHIYNGSTMAKIESIDINEINNIELKFTPDDKYLTVSTFMYEIGVIEFKKTSKFNKNNNTEEVITKVQKNRSIGGIKVPILSYEFSNDPSFFILSSNDKKIKIFQSFAPTYNLEDSKCIKEIDVDFEDENLLPSAENVSLYVIESKQNDFDGVVACTYNSNIYIFNTLGNLIKYIPQAHDSEIIKIKVIKDSESSNPKELFVVSASKDGKINFFRIFN